MKNVAINISSLDSQNNNVCKVFIEGDLSIGNAVEIRSKLQQALLDFSVVEVVADNVTNIDLTSIQIFYSLLKTPSLTNDKSITLELKLNNDLHVLLEQGGFGAILSEIK